MAFKVDADKIRREILYLLLFFMAMNFYGKFFYFSFATLLVLLLARKKLYVDRTVLVYLLLGILMAAYNHGEGILSMLRCFAYVIMYIVGRNLVLIGAEKQREREVDFARMERTAYAAVAAIAGGSFVHYALNFYLSYGKGFSRNTNDIWTGTMMAATGQTALACLMVGFSVALLLAPGKKMHRFIGVGCTVVILAYNLILACRTLLVEYFILLVVGLAYTGRLLRLRERRRLFLWCGAAVLLLIALYIWNVGGVQEYIRSSNLFARLYGTANGTSTVTTRSSIKRHYLLEGYRYPLGGLHLRAEYGYAHDLLLDGYDEYGIGGLLLLCVVLFLGIKALWRFLRKTNCGSTCKLAILCVYTAILLEFYIEPILTGMPWLFPCFCLLNGCVEVLNEWGGYK